MKEINRLDLGSIKIHREVLAEITSLAIQEIKGISLIDKDIRSTLMNLFGYKSFPGIIISIGDNNQVSIEVKIKVDYGMDLMDVARQAQEAIRKAIERDIDIELTDVHVNIRGIERGEK